MWHVKHGKLSRAERCNCGMSRISEFDADYICGLVIGEGSYGRQKATRSQSSSMKTTLHRFFSSKSLEGGFTGLTAMTADVTTSGDCRGNPCRRRCRSLQNAYQRPETAPIQEWIEKYGLAKILAIMGELDRIES